MEKLAESILGRDVARLFGGVACITIEKPINKETHMLGITAGNIYTFEFTDEIKNLNQFIVTLRK